MSKDELWKLYTDRNPGWLSEGANLTPGGIRKLFEQTWDLAHKAGFENGKASAEKVVKLSEFFGDLLSKGGSR